MGVGYGSGKLKEPGRGESVGFNWLLLLHPRWLNFRGLLPIGATAGRESVGFNLYTIDEKPFSFG